ncbi:glycosyltransferase family 4 protein [Mesobacillus jeotgali]|uniref:glycosyltransferase family 4 protein n=1 Tax=Mesobacillus jeotgali TaxID=129985 RepID=UPI001784CF54|nr:glycosyltransferase family 4 protein [Mesobacillus jeotgali]UYZ21814.1 glycosyltransferase family 4 protein [Mesobacillus jeotgali]
MKVLHLISGGETGGSKNHLLSLLKNLKDTEVLLGVFQEGKLSEEARQMGIPVIVYGQSSRYDFSVISKIKQTIKDNQISIVHTHGPRANLFTYFVRQTIPFKWISTIHSDPSQDFIKGGIKGKIFTTINMTVIKKIDHFFAVSERFKQMLVGFGLRAEKITTVYNGISFDEKLQCKLPRVDLQLKEDDFVICMVARLHPIKGHTVVFEALKKVLATKPNVKLLLIGDGPEREDLEREVRDKGLTENVRFLGFQQDVHSYLCLSDVKLLASYSESFPLVILEAARAHTPVISTDVGGVKDLISDPSLGWVVPIKDSAALAGAVTEAINTTNLPELGNNLYEKASRLYSIDQLAKSTEKTYKKI